MPTFEEKGVAIDHLLLDPNNYRFHDDPDYVSAEEERFHEESVQSRAFRRLRDNGLIQLKNSILKNGFLPVERIIARAYPPNSSQYLVVEGNRRVAALKWIKEDHDAGINVPPYVLDTLSAVPVLVVDAQEDESFFDALMGIRHVSGIKEWGGYQRAELVASLRDHRDMDSGDIGDRLGMSTQEVNRRHRAFKALTQMLEDETYGEYARPDMYPMFHEAVSIPVVRDWLGWQEPAYAATNEENRAHFYRLITPDDSEESSTNEPKIPTYSQVRDLRYILPNTEARRVLLDPARTFLDALTIAKREELSEAWKSQVAGVISALESFAVRELRNMTAEDLAEIEKLKDAAAELLETHRKISA